MIGLNKLFYKKGNLVILPSAKRIIAISLYEHYVYGCVVCGCHQGDFDENHTFGTSTWICHNCGSTNCVLGVGFTESSIRFCNGVDDPYRPKIQKHPLCRDTDSKQLIEVAKAIAVSDDELAYKAADEFLAKIKRM
jgi:hypothetical protein